MTQDSQSNLMEQLKNHSARVVVVGLGYVGLPLATVFAEAGYYVTGIDLVQDKVDRINRGESYIQDVPTELVEKLVKSGHLRATSDPAVIAQADAISSCVPTPLRKTGDPDLSFIVSASDMVAEYVHSGMVVVLESSTYPGTT
ncbi:MAG: NAD(P)-binding domain-containing protein, partial [Anaerolineaceae bacterium]